MNDHTSGGSPTRRTALQAGAIGLMGLSMAELSLLQSIAKSDVPRAKSVIFIFLTGGLSHHDSFDMKPDAPDTVRGEYKPVATKVPGIQICEHLPMLARQSDQYALVRSMNTNTNSHGLACHVLLTGRLDLPAGFSQKRVPSPNEWPSIPSQVTYAIEGRNSLPPAIVLPQPSINEAAKVRPGQYAGKLGTRYEAWHVNIASKCPLGNGACPNCFRFDDDVFKHAARNIFDVPMLSLPEGGTLRFGDRVSLLQKIEQQQSEMEQLAESAKLDRHRQQAISVLADPKTRRAFEVEKADPKTLERYGKNKFGLSCLMAKRLVEAGVNLVQVNLGKNSSWDTHRRNFLNLKRNLFPYFDRSISALIEDLSNSGLLDETLVIVTGEFGRTPKINKHAGRDHWGSVFTTMLAGGGVKGGNVVGASDKIGGKPISDPQTPENLAATLFAALGIPKDTQWKDTDGRPHEMYRAEPIDGLT